MSAITREMSALGYQYFDWNVSSTDAAAVIQSKEAIVDSVKSSSDGKNKLLYLCTIWMRRRQQWKHCRKLFPT